jgi:hypothetical protein
MEVRNRRREPIDVCPSQPTLREHSRKQLFLPELAHADGPLDDFAGAVDREAARVVGDGDDIQIEVRRRAAIQPQLILTAAPTRRQRAEIHERERDRLLDLISEVAREDDIRDVGLQQLHRAALRPEDGRITQCRDDVRLRIPELERWIG